MLILILVFTHNEVAAATLAVVVHAAYGVSCWWVRPFRQSVGRSNGEAEALKSKRAAVETSFRFFDADHSGTLDKEEFINLLRGPGKLEMSRAEMDAEWNDVSNASDSGLVSMAEFVDWATEDPVAAVSEAPAAHLDKLSTFFAFCHVVVLLIGLLSRPFTGSADFSGILSDGSSQGLLVTVLCVASVATAWYVFKVFANDKKAKGLGIQVTIPDGWQDDGSGTLHLIMASTKSGKAALHGPRPQVDAAALEVAEDQTLNRLKPSSLQTRAGANIHVEQLSCVSRTGAEAELESSEPESQPSHGIMLEGAEEGFASLSDTDSEDQKEGEI